MTGAAQINLDAYLRARVSVLSARDGGLRKFACPLCRERKGRGWVSLFGWRAGCWNSGCVAEPELAGGVVEWVRRIEGFASRARVWALLLSEFRSTSPTRVKRSNVPLRSTEDWVKWPASRALDRPGHPVQGAFFLFAMHQWGLTASDVPAWGLRFSTTGRYARRVLFPIVMDGVEVGFQARIVGRGEPKYLTSAFGVECGRPASAMLFHYDRQATGREVLLVEGGGDVMGWHRGALERTPWALGLLGVALTAEKCALLAALRPFSVVVALDAQADAQIRARQHAEDLEAWGVPVEMGLWRGGKDAGSGAQLERYARDTDLRGRVAQRLGLA